MGDDREDDTGGDRAEWHRSVAMHERYLLGLGRLEPRSPELVSVACVKCGRPVHGLPSRFRGSQWAQCRHCLPHHGAVGLLAAEYQDQGLAGRAGADEIAEGLRALARRGDAGASVAHSLARMMGLA